MWTCGNSLPCRDEDSLWSDSGRHGEWLPSTSYIDLSGRDCVYEKLVGLKEHKIHHLVTGSLPYTGGIYDSTRS